MKLAETPGERLQRAVYAAAALAGVRATEPAVAEAVGLTRKVVHALFTGAEPRGDYLRMIADGLETTTPEALLAAREGRHPDVGLDRIAHEISELREVIYSAGGGRRQLRDARVAITAAQEDPPGEPGGDPPPEPVASFRRRKSDEETPLRSPQDRSDR